MRLVVFSVVGRGLGDITLKKEVRKVGRPVVGIGVVAEFRD